MLVPCVLLLVLAALLEHPLRLIQYVLVLLLNGRGYLAEIGLVPLQQQQQLQGCPLWARTDFLILFLPALEYNLENVASDLLSGWQSESVAKPRGGHVVQHAAGDNCRPRFWTGK